MPGLPTAPARRRDPLIDILRFIGISLIILSHVEPPALVLSMRTFDVPLMLFVSGMAYASRAVPASASFFWRRFKRLVFPVYIFLTFFFIVSLFLQYTGIFSFDISYSQMWRSYLLMQDGTIGFIWIIRVFLIVALLMPLFAWIDRRVPSTPLLLAGMLCLMVGVTLCIDSGVGAGSMLVRDFLWYAAGYGVMYLLGLRLRHASPLAMLLVAGAFVAVGVAYVALTGVDRGDWLYFPRWKYPPGLYYIMYGVLMSVVCTLLVTRLYTRLFSPPPSSPSSASAPASPSASAPAPPSASAPAPSSASAPAPPSASARIVPGGCAAGVASPARRGLRGLILAVITFIGSNTIWLYLWHIPVVIGLRQLDIAHASDPDWAPLSYPVRYVVIYLSALLVCYLQSLLVGRLSRRRPRPFLSYLKG